MSKLTIEEINKLANKKGVRKIAVENFLMTVENNENERYAKANLWMDAKSYKWNNKTIDAIYKGIEIAFRK